MGSKKIIVVAVSLAILGVIGIRFLANPPPAAPSPPARQTATRQPSPPPQIALEPTPAPAQIAVAAVPEIAPPAPSRQANPQPAPVQSANPGPPPEPPDQRPDARAALAFVGTDPSADAYWASAINDPDLPAEERRNLIEDLNEDGLSNSDHPSAEDLPLVLNRIEMIEFLAPYAMDQVNLDAFAEAYKDLTQMLADGG